MQINFNVVADMSEVTDINNEKQPFHHQIPDAYKFFSFCTYCVTMVNQVRLSKSYILVTEIISTPSLLRMQNPK